MAQPTIPTPASSPFTPTASNFSTIKSNGRTVIASTDHDSVVADLNTINAVLGNLIGIAQSSDAVKGTSAVLVMTPYTTANATQIATFLQAFNG